MKLKVDFKTNILEWKRKYNKLVDGAVVKIETNNIETLSDDELNSLKVGDVVQKKTGNQKHCYVVSYKEENHGICLTYVDCGYMETISYDYTNGHWVLNSKDVKEVLGKNEDIQVNGITSKGIANTGGFANIGDVAISGDLNVQGEGKGKISANTLEQKLANKEFNVVMSTTLPEGLSESETGFKKCKVINGVLWLIILTRIINSTGSSISVGSDLSFDVEVDAETGSKIFKDDGYSINDYASGQSSLVCRDAGIVGANTVSLNVGCYSKNKIHPYCSSFSVPANSNVIVSFRIPLILL